MNLVGKIFTVLVFFMSMVFMTIALMIYSGSSAHPNWKKLVTQYSTELDVEKKKNADLHKEQLSLEDQFKHEVDMAQARLAQLETQYLNLKKERDANNKIVRDKEDEINALAASVRDSHKNLEDLRAIAQKLRDDDKVTLADRNDKFQKSLTRTDEFHDLVAELVRLQKQNRILVDEIQEIENPSARR